MLAIEHDDMTHMDLDLDLTTPGRLSLLFKDWCTINVLVTEATKHDARSYQPAVKTRCVKSLRHPWMGFLKAASM